MKFIRYKSKKDNNPGTKTEYRGILDGDKVVRIDGSFFHAYSISQEEPLHIDDIIFLPPILPNKIIGIRSNYFANYETAIDKASYEPKFFFKPLSSIITTNENIIIPNNENDVRIEGELGIIIGKKAYKVSKHQAEKYIFGYTITNDITAKQSSSDMTITKGKSYNTFTPIGPYIETSLPNLLNTAIKITINNKLVSDSNSSGIIYSPSEIIEYLSNIMVLLPGDLILTGTPTSSIKIEAGDIVAIEIANIGLLENNVINEG